MVTEAGSYLRLIDSCIPQLKAQGPSRTCYESKEEDEDTVELRESESVRERVGEKVAPRKPHRVQPAGPTGYEPD